MAPCTGCGEYLLRAALTLLDGALVCPSCLYVRAEAQLARPHLVRHAPMFPVVELPRTLRDFFMAADRDRPRPK